MDGTPFGRYRLVELIGRGGMGEVWRAFDTDTDRIVAIKVLPAHLSDDETFQQRFRREAHAAARLDSPHVIPIHHYGEIDGRLYVDMRLIKGRDLQAVLADGPLDPARAVRIIEQVAKALHAAHEVGLIHRDVKPSNILLDKDDFAYLIDFGIARATEETRLTSTGSTIGTFQYMAPERLGEHPDEDARADIYALACVLYECLTGQPPFPGTNVGSLVAAHLNTPPPRPSTSQPNVPAQVDEVIATGMAKDPDQRYATTVELANAAHDAITTPIPRPAPSPAPEPPPTEQAPSPVTTVADGTPPPPPTTFPSAATQHRPEQQPLAYAGQLGSAATEHAGWANQPPTRVAPTGQVPPQPASPTTTAVRGLSRRTKITLIAAAVALVVVIAAAISIPAIVGHRPSRSSPTSSESSPTPSRSSPTSPERTYSAQVVLPFTGLEEPEGVAVDAAGNLYVTEFFNNRVLKLPAGSNTQAVLPFTGLTRTGGVAVDAAGNLYVTDFINNRVLKLPAGSASQEVLPFTGLSYPAGVAVDAQGNVYVADTSNNRVVKLAAGSNTQTVLPFTGLNFLNRPEGVAVDAAGNVYVTDGSDQVVKLAAGSNTQTVPITGLISNSGVAVDAAGSVFATALGFVVELPAGSSHQTELPFTDLISPQGVAVDSAGTLYVTDSTTNRVLKLPAQ